MDYFVVNTSLNETELRESYQKNHFEQSIDFTEYQNTYQNMKSVVDGRGLMKQLDYEEICTLVRIPSEYEGDFIAGIVTLGPGVDQLEMEQNAAEEYSEVYRMDCIALDMMSAAYETCRQTVWEKTGRHLSSLQFIGEDLPLDLIPELLNILSAEQHGITCKESFMMLPKKTVIFLSELTSSDRAAEKNSGHICDSCGNLKCGNRNR